jgi:UDP-N-acetylmuramoylalanine--D-glutamate ligase
MYLVAGLGQTGQSVLRYFSRLNEVCLAYDTRTGFDTKVLEKQFPKVKFSTGSLPSQWASKIHCIVLSPGISKSEPWVNELVQSGIEVIGDIELFARSVSNPIVAITGSNGKSTVTTLVGEVLSLAGYQVGLGGNIGVPALDLLTEETVDYDVFVLELSSFQLETTYSLQAKTGTILNISEDHMDRYDSIEDYITAKLSLLKMTEIVVLPDDYKIALKNQPVLTFGLSSQADYGLVTVKQKQYLSEAGQPLIPVEAMTLQGGHHQLNALAVMALCAPFNISAPIFEQVLRQFKGLPHRTQVIAQYEEVLWINDSKGTNVGATITAIETLGPSLKNLKKPLILIAGGVGKDADFSGLQHSIEVYVSHTLVFGQAKLDIAKCLPVHSVTQVEDLKEAIAYAALRVKMGGTVLFSPACASFDQFENYIDRGEKFEKWVHEHLKEDARE